MGRRPSRFHGVLLVDKPVGPTSFDVVAAVRRALRERRVGHAGTLDPLASGLLPVCVGEATKIVPYLMDGSKVYAARVLFGATTSTDDAEGEVVERFDGELPGRADVDAAVAGFVGAIQQVPPAFSAIKIDGKRAYEYARAGEAVELAAREVTVHGIDVQAYEPPELSLRVDCGKGTYIRALARDLGRELGCGAHLVGLRRERVGALDVARALPLDALAEGEPSERLVSLDDALAHLPVLALGSEHARRLGHGQKLPEHELGDVPEGVFRVHDERRALIAVAELIDGVVRVRRGLRVPEFNEVRFDVDTRESAPV